MRVISQSELLRPTKFQLQELLREFRRACLIWRKARKNCGLPITIWAIFIVP
jgi:hypothetical protein